MRVRRTFRNLGLAAAVIGLGAGLAVPAGGCGGSADLQPPESVTAPQVPALDAGAPRDYRTASFALG